MSAIPREGQGEGTLNPLASPFNQAYNLLISDYSGNQEDLKREIDNILDNQNITDQSLKDTIDEKYNELFDIPYYEKSFYEDIYDKIVWRQYIQWEILYEVEHRSEEISEQEKADLDNIFYNQFNNRSNIYDSVNESIENAILNNHQAFAKTLIGRAYDEQTLNDVQLNNYNLDYTEKFGEYLGESYGANPELSPTGPPPQPVPISPDIAGEGGGGPPTAPQEPEQQQDTPQNWHWAGGRRVPNEPEPTSEIIDNPDFYDFDDFIPDNFNQYIDRTNGRVNLYFKNGQYWVYDTSGNGNWIPTMGMVEGESDEYNFYLGDDPENRFNKNELPELPPQQGGTPTTTPEGTTPEGTTPTTPETTPEGGTPPTEGTTTPPETGGTTPETTTPTAPEGDTPPYTPKKPQSTLANNPIIDHRREAENIVSGFGVYNSNTINEFILNILIVSVFYISLRVNFNNNENKNLYKTMYFLEKNEIGVNNLTLYPVISFLGVIYAWLLHLLNSYGNNTTKRIKEDTLLNYYTKNNIGKIFNKKLRNYIESSIMNFNQELTLNIFDKFQFGEHPRIEHHLIIELTDYFNNFMFLNYHYLFKGDAVNEMNHYFKKFFKENNINLYNTINPSKDDVIKSLVFNIEGNGMTIMNSKWRSLTNNILELSGNDIRNLNIDELIKESNYYNDLSKFLLDNKININGIVVY